ncbi:MAG: aromatic ring-hydroxylating dioxygenase subunit alpha [Myxococcota bacterium]
MQRPPDRGPPSDWYVDPAQLSLDLEAVFAMGWALVGDDRHLTQDGSWWPATLLPGSLNEPLLFTKSEGQIRAFANLCTHRSAQLVDAPGHGRVLRCPYHGRCFALDGNYRSALGFDGPQPNLHPVAHQAWRGLLFAHAGPRGGTDLASAPFRPIQDLLEPLAFADWPSMAFDANDSVDYVIEAPWATYVENYLEGLHIPFVHPGLARSLELDAYEIQTHPAGALQIGVAAPGDACLELPADHPFAGQRIAALYAYIFPGTIINLYPWGASINLIQPLSTTQTRVRYLTYVADYTLRGSGAGADVHQTEAEDQAVVKRVAAGLTSRWSRPATYAAGHEDAVAWFHELWRAARRKHASVLAPC